MELISIYTVRKFRWGERGRGEGRGEGGIIGGNSPGTGGI